MYLLQKEGISIDTEKMKDAVREIALEGKIEKLCKLVEEYLSYIGNIAWQRYDEKYIKSYMHGVLLTTPIFNTYLEFNVRNNKYIDVAIFKNGTEGVKYQAIIEVKYLKKEEKTKANIEKKRNEAIEQIEEYMKDERLPKDNLKKFIVLYIGQKMEFLEEIQ